MDMFKPVMHSAGLFNGRYPRNTRALQGVLHGILIEIPAFVEGMSKMVNSVNEQKQKAVQSKLSSFLLWKRERKVIVMQGKKFSRPK